MKKLPILFSLLSSVACDISQPGELGRLFFNDQESLTGPADGRYAVGDELFLSVSFASGVQPVSLTAASSDFNVMAFEPNAQQGGFFVVRGTALGEGSAALEMRSSETDTLFDRITLRAATAEGVGAFLPGSFGATSLAPPVLTLFETSEQSMILRPQTASGETLKGQLSGELVVDPAVASLAVGSSLLGTDAVLRAEGVGVSALSITANTFSQELPIEVVPFSATELSTELSADEDGVVRGTGLLQVRSLLPDGRAVLGGVYEAREDCIQNLAGSCLLDDEQIGFLDDTVIFGVVASGTTALEIRLLDQAGNLQQSTLVEVTVEVQ